jgi:tRNA threonylcarbamoyladenosine biosynthesis protein TsaB
MAGHLLAIDTATSRAVLAVGAAADGSLLALDVWPAGHAHAETLLPRLSALLAANDVPVEDIVGVVVGIGPGSFTGLRVGLATAKTLAYGLRRPIVGLGSAMALAAAVGLEGRATVILPAGPRDRYVVSTLDHGDGARLLAPSAFEDWLAGHEGEPATLVAVDLEDSHIPDAAHRRGRAALDLLGPALLRLGAAELAAGRSDDVSALVPAYVTLPRGVPVSAGGATWSPDLR